eukprot:m.34678 g.34678  ORF g.34678 m.34678 type:complete len:614 (-) comp6547_c0_seq1:192-2033(-)
MVLKNKLVEMDGKSWSVNGDDRDCEIDDGDGIIGDGDLTVNSNSNHHCVDGDVKAHGGIIGNEEGDGIDHRNDRIKKENIMELKRSESGGESSGDFGLVQTWVHAQFDKFKKGTTSCSFKRDKVACIPYGAILPVIYEGCWAEKSEVDAIIQDNYAHKCACTGVRDIRDSFLANVAGLKFKAVKERFAAMVCSQCKHEMKYHKAATPISHGEMELKDERKKLLMELLIPKRKFTQNRRTDKFFISRHGNCIGKEGCTSFQTFTVAALLHGNPEELEKPSTTSSSSVSATHHATSFEVTEKKENEQNFSTTLSNPIILDSESPDPFEDSQKSPITHHSTQDEENVVKPEHGFQKKKTKEEDQDQEQEEQILDESSDNDDDNNSILVDDEGSDDADLLISQEPKVKKKKEKKTMTMLKFLKQNNRKRRQEIDGVENSEEEHERKRAKRTITTSDGMGSMEQKDPSSKKGDNHKGKTPSIISSMFSAIKKAMFPSSSSTKTSTTDNSISDQQAVEKDMDPSPSPFKKLVDQAVSMVNPTAKISETVGVTCADNGAILYGVKGCLLLIEANATNSKFTINLEQAEDKPSQLQLLFNSDDKTYVGGCVASKNRIMLFR